MLELHTKYRDVPMASVAFASTNRFHGATGRLAADVQFFYQNSTPDGAG